MSITKNKKVKNEEVVNEYADFDVFKEFADIIEDSDNIKEPTYIEPINVNYDGETVKLNGKFYVLPSLSVGQLRKFSQTNVDFSKMNDNQQIDMITFLTLCCFRRNYKDMTREWLDSVMPLSQIMSFTSFITSGLTFKDLQNQKKS